MGLLCYHLINLKKQLMSYQKINLENIIQLRKKFNFKIKKVSFESFGRNSVKCKKIRLPFRPLCDYDFVHCPLRDTLIMTRSTTVYLCWPSPFATTPRMDTCVCVCVCSVVAGQSFVCKYFSLFTVCRFLFVCSIWKLEKFFSIHTYVLILRIRRVGL